MAEWPSTYSQTPSRCRPIVIHAPQFAQQTVQRKERGATPIRNHASIIQRHAQRHTLPQCTACRPHRSSFCAKLLAMIEQIGLLGRVLSLAAKLNNTPMVLLRLASSDSSTLLATQERQVDSNGAKW